MPAMLFAVFAMRAQTRTQLGTPVTPRSSSAGRPLGRSVPSLRCSLVLFLPRAELCTPLPVLREVPVGPKLEFLYVALDPQFAESMIFLPYYIYRVFITP